MNKGLRIRCINPVCSPEFSVTSKYKCVQCGLDNLDALTKREKHEKQAVLGTQNLLFTTREYKIPKKSKSNLTRDYLVTDSLASLGEGGQIFT